MSKSVHQFEIKGVDKSAGAFSSIKSRASVTGAQIRSMVGGAFAALGGYLTFSAVKDGVDELGHLSDIAQKTSTRVDELTRATAAMGALGIQNMGIDQLGKAFDFMTKSTGRSGIDGFMQTIGELGKIPDAAQRSQEAMKVFGKSGVEFMPIINAADESVEALKAVVAAMPAVPQAAADMGDDVSDAMGFAANQMKSIWLQGLGAVCGWFGNEYKGGVREASLAAGNYLEYYTKVAVAKCITWWRKLQEFIKAYGSGNFIGAFVGAKMAGASWGEAWTMAKDAWKQGVDEYDDIAEELEAREEARTTRFKQTFEDRAIAISKFAGAYSKAAISLKDREKKDGVAFDNVHSTKISNDLIMGGSNALSKLQIFGPSYQSESKKQTSLLEKIATNTEKTADNTDGGEELATID